MILLASASPRRQETLRRLGLPFTVRATTVDETPPNKADVNEATLAIAARKAEAAGAPASDFVVAADTLGALGEELIGKPRDPAHAREILGKLQGRTHEVVTAIVVRGPNRRTVAGTESTRVTFRALTPQEIDAYVATGEPLDKACAYAVQGKARTFISKIDGDESNVVGFPIQLLLRLLHEAGYPLPTHLRPS